MFGTLPPLPAARFEFSGEVNPEFLRVSEQLREGAFYSDVLDMKTTQLILFGMLLAEHNTVGAQAHAAAARKAGASWEELHTVMQLAAATGALWAANNGGALLKALRDKEQGDQAMIVSRRAALAAALVADRDPGAGRRLSGAEAGRLDRQGLPLPHRRCDARGSPALHDGRRADRRAGAAPAWHRRCGRELPDAGLCRRTVRRRPAARCQKYFIILPDALGAGKSAKPSDGLRAKFPLYNYADMVAAQHRLVTEGLGIKHLRLVIGNSMGGMQTWMWGSAYPDFMDALVPMAAQPTAMSSRNWMMRRMITDAVRNDPDWNNGNYTTQPRAFRTANAFFRIATSGGTWPIRKWRRRARRPTSC